MSSSIVAIALLIFIYGIENNQIDNIYAIVFGINVGYFYRYVINSNFTFDQIIKYLFYGENLYSLVYLIWLKGFGKFTYVFFVPIFLSSIAKLTWLFTPKDKLNPDFI